MKYFGSVNEWGMLREVIVGDVNQAMYHDWQVLVKKSSPSDLCAVDCSYPIGAIPPEVVLGAESELSNFVGLLTKHGIIVHRPDIFPHNEPFCTPLWKVGNGISSANPRDSLLVVGNTIIECPMNDRGRYFETFAYKSILHDCFNRGARWIAAPKPTLCESCYKRDAQELLPTEKEPVFDAADFLKLGPRTLIGQLSNATNRYGVEWLKRSFEDNLAVHMIATGRTDTLHIDTTITLLEEGVAMINPDFLSREDLPAIFDDWTVHIAPRPISFWTDVSGRKIVSDWMSINILNLGKRTVVVEEKQLPLIEFLTKINYNVITCPFEHYYAFGGSFHCATLDIARDPL